MDFLIAKLMTNFLSLLFMNFSVFLLQIHELFEGHFNWRGVLFLSLFILMGLMIVGFSVFAGYKAFMPKRKDK